MRIATRAASKRGQKRGAYTLKRRQRIRNHRAFKVWYYNTVMCMNRINRGIENRMKARMDAERAATA